MTEQNQENNSWTNFKFYIETFNRNHKKNQTKIQELKNTMTELKTRKTKINTKLQ